MDQRFNLDIDLSEFSMEDLFFLVDTLALGLLTSAGLTQREIRELDEQRNARLVASGIAYRYLEVLHHLAERYSKIEKTKEELNKLL